MSATNRKPKLYLAPYHSNLHKEKINAGVDASNVLRSYVSAIKEQNAWPFDTGDDPSFFSSWYFDAPITWGVCRGDLRNAIFEGCVVVFFAFTDFEDRTEYRLSGVATVDRLIKQTDIFENQEFFTYREYLNLLTSPGSSTSEWRWLEPCFPDVEHPNWLWRLADRSIFGERDFDHFDGAPSIRVNHIVNGKPYQFGKNYIIFSSEPAKTYVIDKPPVVAEWVRHGGHHREVWRSDPLSQAVFGRTVRFTNRGLRTRGSYPHCPAARCEIREQALDSWRTDFVSLLQQHGLRRRTSGSPKCGDDQRVNTLTYNGSPEIKNSHKEFRRAQRI